MEARLGLGTQVTQDVRSLPGSLQGETGVLRPGLDDAHAHLIAVAAPIDEDLAIALAQASEREVAQ